VKRVLLFLGFAAALAAACGSDDKSSDDDDAARGASSTASGQGASSASSSGSTGDGGGAEGGGGAGGVCSPPTGTFDIDGCLTFASASTICGIGSDGSICTFSVGCGLSESESQCEINCEMGTTVNCYDQAAVDCLYESAICSASCSDLSACGWIL
jgi:hypothetical protein